ncbi:TetR/AcrR family transcriptional regulator [Actinomadura rubrisoli]|uniref:TetR family transcriptional regulator n=1 Tax=Actinomadura rubrisoli TaxID=2530368 RepID=A0A4R5AE87_9ACTN|nr:TetR family transcriptional regulator [Actinomadura rubrisoli]TDD70838.1 TetR family transcriptional regulator [Actinomadura rubrisoli]
MPSSVNPRRPRPTADPGRGSPSPPGSRRGYESPLRQRQAQQTRAAILDAAEQQFSAHGYVRTRLKDVAEQAGVSLATVKLAFGTKIDLLLGLWHRTLAGGTDDQAPVADRPWMRAALQADDPAAKLRQVAANSAMIKQRTAALARIITAAAAADDTAAELQAQMSREFYANQHSIIEDLHRRGQLHPELTVTQATDILFTLNNMQTYLLLVHERRWTPDHYQQWLTTTLQRELLLPDHENHSTRAT